LGGRSIHKYVAIHKCVEVHGALPFTKGINFKSDELNKQSIQKRFVLIGKEQTFNTNEENKHFIISNFC
jgi:hypothetical protein